MPPVLPPHDAPGDMRSRLPHRPAAHRVPCGTGNSPRARHGPAESAAQSGCPRGTRLPGAITRGGRAASGSRGQGAGSGSCLHCRGHIKASQRPPALGEGPCPSPRAGRSQGASRGSPPGLMAAALPPQADRTVFPPPAPGSRVRAVPHLKRREQGRGDPGTDPSAGTPRSRQATPPM